MSRGTKINLATVMNAAYPTLRDNLTLSGNMSVYLSIFICSIFGNLFPKLLALQTALMTSSVVELSVGLTGRFA